MEIEVCLIVVVTTVVEEPVPSVYVRTTDSELVSWAPLDPLTAFCGAEVIPVPRGMADAGVDTAPADVAVAE